eukprot:COSAG01_NODE_46758_length_397_cov_0.855705_1_plen_131_part_11
MVSEIQKLGHNIDAEEIQRLGQTFVTEGKLQRSLLPWLWRHQPQRVRNPEEMDFLIDLLTQLGLLTRIPESDPRQWILPIRLPDRDRATAAAKIGTLLRQIEKTGTFPLLVRGFKFKIVLLQRAWRAYVAK